MSDVLLILQLLLRKIWLEKICSNKFFENLTDKYFSGEQLLKDKMCYIGQSLA
jgi:hypothetical protein